MENIYPEDDRELAAMCSNWQQLDILKRRRQERREGKIEHKHLKDMTRSEAKLWYRNNTDLVEEDKQMAGHCSNYRQLEIMRGNGAMQGKDWEETRSKRITWFRNGGSEVVDNEKYLASQCSNWKQFHLLTRGSAASRSVQESDEEEIEEKMPTRSENLLWYRNGGHYVCDDVTQLAKQSENWIQYKLTRDARQHSTNLYNAVQTNYSDFRSKEALYDYLSTMRMNGYLERQDIRQICRTKSISDSVTKSAYEYHLQPYTYEESAQAASLSAETQSKISKFEENLRRVTEEVMMMRSEYSESAREMAMKAIKADEEAVAASRMKRKTMVVQQNVSATA